MRRRAPTGAPRPSARDDAQSPPEAWRQEAVALCVRADGSPEGDDVQASCFGVRRSAGAATAWPLRLARSGAGRRPVVWPPQRRHLCRLRRGPSARRTRSAAGSGGRLRASPSRAPKRTPGALEHGSGVHGGIGPGPVGLVAVERVLVCLIAIIHGSQLSGSSAVGTAALTASLHPPRRVWSASRWTTGCRSRSR